MRVVVIADGASVCRFQLDALNALTGCTEIDVLSCTNSRNRRKLGRHWAYYLLDLLATGNRMARRVPLSGAICRIATTLEFESDHDGAWQRFPKHVLDWLRDRRPDVILKFGMGALRVPGRDELPAPILSYRPVDSEDHSGRPAGFHEILNGAPLLGQIVQVLSDRPDAGRVVAFAETTVRPHSYKATLVEAYSASPLLLDKAVKNVMAGVYLRQAPTGRNDRLPSNRLVLRFLIRMLLRKIERLAYGAFIEKGWQVSVASFDEHRLDQLVTSAFPARDSWRTLPIAKGYNFYADPFFSTDPPGILVEALRGSTGRADLLLWSEGRTDIVLADRGHVSYPFTFLHQGRQMVLPEIAEWSEPRLFAARGGTLVDVGALRIAGGGRLFDPTLLRHGGRLYLFANAAADGVGVLRLWHAERLSDEFEPHPASPIRISPEGSRMGGALFRTPAGLFRWGQRNSGRYGDGLHLFRIDRIDPVAFEEVKVGELRLEGSFGPHTLNAYGGDILFDWYRNRFSLLAGIRRLVARLERNEVRSAAGAPPDGLARHGGPVTAAEYPPARLAPRSVASP